MLKHLVIGVYRLLASLVIILPIGINYLLNGGIIVSFITIPLLCLCLVVFAIWLDQKVVNRLSYISANNKLSVQNTNKSTHSSLNIKAHTH